MSLATINPELCPDCGEPVNVTPYDQPAMFVHGGYGATSRTVYAHCVCGWSLQREQSEVRP